MSAISKKNTSKRPTWAVWRTALLAALLLIGYLGGAILGNIILRTDFSLSLALGLFVWAGVWLRQRTPEINSGHARDDSGKEAGMTR